jgi:hypothetical protein
MGRSSISTFGLRVYLLADALDGIAADEQGDAQTE